MFHRTLFCHYFRASRTVRAKDHDGKEVTFEGVELGEVLKLAGAKFSE
jgi:hypothetical protein